MKPGHGDPRLGWRLAAVLSLAGFMSGCLGGCMIAGTPVAHQAPVRQIQAGAGFTHHATDAVMLALQSQASTEQYQAVANALHASPMLAAQLDGLVQTRLLTRIVIGDLGPVAPPSDSSATAAPAPRHGKGGEGAAIRAMDTADTADNAAAAGHFGAVRIGTEWHLSAGFVAAQASRRSYDRVNPDDILPNNMVFALGYLAYKTQQAFSLQANLRAKAQNHGTHRARPDELKRAWIELHLRDDAGAFIQAWNDVEDAALAQNRHQPLSVSQAGALLLNLRYRGPLLKALRQPEPNHVSIGPRGIDPTQHNLDAMTLALRDAAVIEIEP